MEDNESSTNKFVPEYRRTNFKNKSRFTADELRRRRDTQQVELRKAKRDEVLAKRRNFVPPTEGEDSEDEEDNQNADQQFYNQLQQELPQMIQQIQSNDLQEQLSATIKFRQILSREYRPPIDVVIQSGVVPTLVNFMDQNQPEMLQLEAAWALTNIASGTSEQTKYVVDSGAVPLFIQLLYTGSVEVQEQAIWALGNVAGDSTSYRDYVLQCGAMEPILNLFNSTKTSLIRTATWTLSNLCRGKKPQPDWSIVSQALPTLSKLIYSLDDETLVDACWAISYLSDGPPEAIQAVIDARIPKKLVELLGSASTMVQTPALRAVGNIVTGNDLQTQVIINCGVLGALRNLLSSQKESIKKEACWTISNITAGNAEQIQAVIDANVVPSLVAILKSSDYKTQKEACWAISNASSGGLQKSEIIRYLVSQDCIKPLCDLLEMADNRIMEVALDALENILKVGEKDKEARGLAVNENADLIEKAGGMEKIFNCQQNQNDKIYNKAFNIIETYFGEDDEVIDESMAPETSGNTFGFGSNVSQQFNFN
ncbi:similar to Saccharomyces cerevisiae YNL189W SRP1 Karyopherin alpha homolog [Maudiozyma barnettii]|uniref:Importin subunit alpha n=1 Tax=Maudiozyma barnettii TaxID=61262 RepID=A0A8H2ZJ45_9SACH|nr:karyopherin alpha [Kazachstania barnettii]CAB4253882.1 similar to Saccharomyces cerevisiae YNL189W SRP1 Karyopherin alpha homolog [Kazachstania barnettii]CAD1781632.1 similar to Saccharomyces cerevisiae YNL189W SRP1 Karyopherin alpha homolog [Kazachstania barnettii]